ncbi:DegT/DnrJ/EryC1/StrS family aminotransferase [Phycisphaerales bacterium AB-hyl4]|uniref:DegT/DnrJ/EryC1/StrS family aminotransferase n=1 Tax=Natronomicrosphaera hydrolytica TaxID=3242702 RepID=A0ABV4U314_9BACT
MSHLAIDGGEKVVCRENPDMFAWPIVNREMEAGVLDILRRGAMSQNDVTKRFERGYARWHGVKYALGHNNGTASLEAAMYAVGVRRGDEIIAPSMTYWATCVQALGLGAKVVFADIDPETLCIDPDDIEHRITDKTRAIVLVHYLGIVADMDRICAIARKHNLKIIEDASHAHGSLYHDKMAGTFGDVGCFSLMSSKGFAVGEAGILITDDREIYERAILYGHYIRHDELTDESIRAMAGLPVGGCKYRMHQMSAAVGVAQLKKYPAEMAEIDAAMRYYWSLLKDVPGIRPIQATAPGSSMGAWYFPHAHYDRDCFDGLSVQRFCEALQAEGSKAIPGVNAALHKHPLFSKIDIFGDGHPTNQLSGGRDVSTDPLPVTEGIQERVFGVPWFKHLWKDEIELHAAAVRKVAANYRDLLAGDKHVTAFNGHWGLSTIKT